MSKKKKFNFIEQIIKGDIEKGKYKEIKTRFPPEPNGFLHIGHAKSIVLNFSLTETFPGSTNLRFDDTNPLTEKTDYVDSIKKDIEWLGYQWEGDVKFTSEYFDTLYEFALKLIRKGLAYVDDSTLEEIAQQKGNVNTPGFNSPYRDRSIEENEELFKEMKAGNYTDGSKVLRAKIDMSAANMHMRDPIIYRIKHIHHHRTGNKWCIYPMYDFAHGQSDAIENITHSICTLEFENHRPLYDWFIEKLELFPSRQIEFSRLNLTYTIMSKRKLLELVENKKVSGWDDPRMPTISAMRRRGYPAEAIRNFAEDVGVTKREQFIDLSRLENHVRKIMNRDTQRVMVVLNPVVVHITNLPDDYIEYLDMVNNPEAEVKVTHKVPFTNTIYIEREDFMENPPKKFFRMYIGANVRLKGAYILQCDEVVKDDTGEIVEIKCRYFPESKSGQDTSGIKAKGTLHWVARDHAINIEVHQYDRLFTEEFPTRVEGKNFIDFINPNSLKVITRAKAEKFLLELPSDIPLQFLRKGYFVKDPLTEGTVYNQTVSLKDNWSKK